MELFDNKSVFAALCLLAYLLGSIPTGKILGKLKGIDIQKKGSGNIGFANSVRVLGWQYGSVVLIFDVLKGYVPTLIASRYFEGYSLLLIATVAILAHIYPVWLGFKGGKGIATGLGVFLAISPIVALLGLSVYLFTFLRVSNSGFSSVVASWSLSVFAAIYSPELVLFAYILAILGTYTHRSNLRNYLVQNVN